MSAVRLMESPALSGCGDFLQVVVTSCMLWWLLAGCDDFLHVVAKAAAAVDTVTGILNYAI